MINQKIRETVTLNNGVEMPRIGLGTVFLKEEIMRDALRYGFYNIDTADLQDLLMLAGKGHQILRSGQKGRVRHHEALELVPRI